MTDFNAFLSKLTENLNILREREAKYGGNAPLDLLNQIEDHQKAIALTEQIIAGELTEDEWHEATGPLLLAVHNGRVVNLTEVDTGGGAYVEGTVNMGSGDFVGRDQMGQIAIGHGIIQVIGSGTSSVHITHSQLAAYRPPLYRKILRKEPLSYTLILTEKTFTFRGRGYQLSNLTNIRKYKLSREAKYRIPVSILTLTTIAFLTCVYILTYTPFTTDWSPVGVSSIAIAISSLVVIVYAVYERCQPPTSIARLEMSTSSRINLMSKDEKFMDRLLLAFTDALNKPDPPICQVFNTTDRSMVVYGDVTLNEHRPGLTDENKRFIKNMFEPKLQEFQERLEALGNSAGLKDLESFVDELNKSSPNESSLRTYWQKLRDRSDTGAFFKNSIGSIPTVEKGIELFSRLA